MCVETSLQDGLCGRAGQTSSLVSEALLHLDVVWWCGGPTVPGDVLLHVAHALQCCRGTELVPAPGAAPEQLCCRPVWRGLPWGWLISFSVAGEILWRILSAEALDFFRRSYIGTGLQAYKEPASSQDTQGQSVNLLTYVFRLHRIGEAALVLISSRFWYFFCSAYPTGEIWH